MDKNEEDKIRGRIIGYLYAFYLLAISMNPIAMVHPSVRLYNMRRRELHQKHIEVLDAARIDLDFAERIELEWRMRQLVKIDPKNLGVFFDYEEYQKENLKKVIYLLMQFEFGREKLDG